MNILWNAKKYADDFSFVSEYGEAVAKLLKLDKDALVLDLGCGNGRLTHWLSMQGYSVIGLDGSQELLEIARRNYPSLSFIHADATEFSLMGQVDGVFSNAVLHWIEKKKQPQVFRCVHNALKNGGQFVFEMGGIGNNALIHSALKKEFAAKGLKYKMPFYFPTVGEYAAMLEKSGFKVTDMLLFDRFTELKGEDGLADWIKMFVKTPFDGVAESLKDDIISAVTYDLKDDLYQNGKWYADYVRLRGKAIKE